MRIYAGGRIITTGARDCAVATALDSGEYIAIRSFMPGLHGSSAAVTADRINIYRVTAYSFPANNVVAEQHNSRSAASVVSTYNDFSNFTSTGLPLLSFGLFHDSTAHGRYWMWRTPRWQYPIITENDGTIIGMAGSTATGQNTKTAATNTTTWSSQPESDSASGIRGRRFTNRGGTMLVVTGQGHNRTTTSRPFTTTGTRGSGMHILDVTAYGSGVQVANPASLLNLLYVTGTTFTQDVAGTLTTAGVLRFVVNKNVAGTLTSSGALVRQAIIIRGGTLTTAGNPAKQVVKAFAGTLTTAGALTPSLTYVRTFAGTLTSAGALVRQANKVVTGTLTTAGVVVRLPAIIRGGTLTTAGALVRQANRTLTGTLTTAGALTASRSVVRTVTGTLTTAGTLVRQAQIVRGGTLTTAGSLVRQPAKVLTGSLTTAGSVTFVRSIVRTFAGTLTSAGALVRQVAITRGGSLAAAGALVRQAGKTFSGVLTTAGSLTAERSGTSLMLGGVLATAGAVARTVNLAITATLTVVGALLIEGGVSREQYDATHQGSIGQPQRDGSRWLGFRRGRRR